ncbi:MAG: sulfurtransferase TusA family protein [Paracoccus sp. (in: a-proteobacteria)]
MEIDARGLLCPLPVLRLRKALTLIAPGSCVTLLATDRMAAIDIPHFCAESGHELISVTPLDTGATRYNIRRASCTDKS